MYVPLPRRSRGALSPTDICAKFVCWLCCVIFFQALMTVETAQGTPFHGLLGQEGGIAREDDLLCLLLLYHRHVLAEQSPFRKHIDVLPREYHQTIFYSGQSGPLLHLFHEEEQKC